MESTHSRTKEPAMGLPRTTATEHAKTEDLMLRKDGDVADDELQQALTLDILGPQTLPTDCELNPSIRLQKAEPQGDACTNIHHRRKPDIGIGIRVTIPCYKASGIIEYYGQYVGHGASKTAFQLHNPDAPFHGKVLKVAKANDLEPSVLIKTAQANLTTSLLYNCHGEDANSGLRFHCWITEYAIPLDEFCRFDEAVKTRCSLAAFCCILKAALQGFYISDCHFFNFGVQLTENATEHLVIIIDAGSRGINLGEQWPKSEVNTTIMHKFWKWCDKESATNEEIKTMWRTANNIEDCLKQAEKLWQQKPFLTWFPQSTCSIRQAMLAKDSQRRSVAQSKSAYKIIELVGRFAAGDQWNEECTMVCYTASEDLGSRLPSEQSNILDELHQRIAYTGDIHGKLYKKSENELLLEVMSFWAELNVYRERNYRRLLQINEGQLLTPKQASHILENFKYDMLWYDLTEKQRHRKNWRSTVNTILHKKSGWIHAAKAIMQQGLPKFEQPAEPEDATEHVNAIGQLAKDMAEWLINFASKQHAYSRTEKYQTNYRKSIDTMQRRHKKASASKSGTAWS